jgi:hypothetical protein
MSARDFRVEPLDPLWYDISFRYLDETEQHCQEYDPKKQKLTPRFVWLWGTENQPLQLFRSFMNFFEMTWVSEIVHHQIEFVLERFELFVVVHYGVDEALVTIFVSLIVFFIRALLVQGFVERVFKFG